MMRHLPLHYKPQCSESPTLIEVYTCHLDYRSLAKTERGAAGLGLLKNTVFMQALKNLESRQHLSPVVMQESSDKMPALGNIDGPGPAQSGHYPGTQANLCQIQKDNTQAVIRVPTSRTAPGKDHV